MRSAEFRNPRLYPSLSHSRYWVLIGLRRAVERFVEDHVQGRGFRTALDVVAGAAPYRPLFAPHVERYTSGTGAEAEATSDGRSRCRTERPTCSSPIRFWNTWRISGPTSSSWRGSSLLTESSSSQTTGIGRVTRRPATIGDGPARGSRRVLERAVKTVGILGRAAAGLQLLHDGVAGAIPVRLHPLFAFCLAGMMRFAARLDHWDRAEDASAFVVTARRSRGGEAA